MKTPSGMDAASQELSRLIDSATFAQLLYMSKRSVQRLLDQGKLPKPIRLGRCMRWVRSEIEDWIAAKCPDLSRLQKRRGA